MRLEHIQVPFTAVGNNLQAALINLSGFRVFGVYVITTSTTGAPGSWHFDVRPGHMEAGVFVGASNANDTMRTETDIGYVKYLGVTRVRTTKFEFAWDNAWPVMQITPELSGGAAPTVTGVVDVFGQVE
jgi:hypothetical protein